MKTENNYAFIDAQNVHLSIKRLGWELDWQKFFVHLSRKYSIKKAYIFLGYIPGNAELYRLLQSYGYDIIFKDVLRDKLGKYKGNVDAELVLYSAAIEYEQFDKAVIVSGDGDFACLVKFLLDRDKLCAIMPPDQNRYSSLLNKASKENKNILCFISRARAKLEKIEKIA